MEVTKSHHIDCSEPDADGCYDYYYEYDLYRFSEAETVLVARHYFDDPDAHFLRVEEGGVIRMVSEGDLRGSLVRMAIAHLEKEGIKDIRYLGSQGYAKIGGEAEAERPARRVWWKLW
ncbi:hypothetical protein ASA1KI_11250 [Opitutales bacterium ASA1]|nr:hypothetical protein ASA1KI_11250 [Opitutales bacterium ASA1]